jgi:CheY-like chemotaxis protein
MKSDFLVLIVDDDEASRELYSRYFEHSGLRCCEARNGQEAIVRALERHPDVIVMDVVMPGMTGIQTARALKRDAETRQMPIIAVTAYDLAPRDRRQFEACLLKPCLPEDLLARVLRAACPAAPGACTV